MEVSFNIPTDQMNEYLKELFSHGESTVVLEESVSLSDGLGAYLGDAGMTVLIGLVVVIGTLLVLTGIFYLFGFVMSSADRKAKKAAAKKAVETATVSTPEQTVAPAAPVVQAGISGEVVAAIAAAVAMMAPEGKRYAIKSVSRATGGGRSAWSAAGVADNTRPF